jgi:hypothetical protein
MQAGEYLRIDTHLAMGIGGGGCCRQRSNTCEIGHASTRTFGARHDRVVVECGECDTTIWCPLRQRLNVVASHVPCHCRLRSDYITLLYAGTDNQDPPGNK